MGCFFLPGSSLFQPQAVEDLRTLRNKHLRIGHHMSVWVEQGLAAVLCCVKGQSWSARTRHCMWVNCCHFQTRGSTETLVAGSTGGAYGLLIEGPRLPLAEWELDYKQPR